MRPANNASCFYLQFLSLICIVLPHITCLFFEPCKDHKQRETETPLLSSKSKCFAVALGGIIIHPNTSCQSWGGNGLSLQGSCYSTLVEKCAVDEGFCCTDLFCFLLENSIPGSLPSQENNNKVYEALNHGPVPWNHPAESKTVGHCPATWWLRISFLVLFFFSAIREISLLFASDRWVEDLSLRLVLHFCEHCQNFFFFLFFGVCTSDRVLLRSKVIKGCLFKKIK